MSCSGRIKKKADKVCAGDMNKPIGFINRDIVPDDFSFDMVLTPSFTAYCMIQTIRGTESFDGVNVNRSPDTIKFTTRAGYAFEKKMLASYNGLYFEVINIENLNGDNRFKVVTCTELGITTKPVNRGLGG